MSCANRVLTFAQHRLSQHPDSYFRAIDRTFAAAYDDLHTPRVLFEQGNQGVIYAETIVFHQALHAHQIGQARAASRGKEQVGRPGKKIFLARRLDCARAGFMCRRRSTERSAVVLDSGTTVAGAGLQHGSVHLPLSPSCRPASTRPARSRCHCVLAAAEGGRTTLRSYGQAQSGLDPVAARP
jgi:hypothetical protein